VRRDKGSIRPGVTALLVTAVLYGVLFALTTGSWPIPLTVIGALVVITAAVTAVQYRWAHRPLWVRGTGEVVEVSSPPSTGTHGLCALLLNIASPGLGSTRQQVRERHVPVRSWPQPGDRVPLQVDVNDHRRVRVLWSQWRPSPDLDDDLDDLPPPPPSSEAAEPAPWDEVDLDPAFDEPTPFPGYAPEAEYEPTFTEEDLETLSPRRMLPLTDEPTAFVARYLYPTERYRGEWRRHWMRPFTRYALVLALAVLLAVEARYLVPNAHLTTARGLICLIGALLSLYALIAWRYARLALTNHRVLLVEGLFWRRVSDLSLEDMSQLRLELTPLGQFFGYGDFIFPSARRFTAIRRVAVLPNPNELYLRLTEERHDPEAVEARLAPYDDVSDFDDP
jgi:hypothetical protein